MDSLNTLLTESQAIELAKKTLSETQYNENLTISYMEASEAENFIWGFLYDMGLQYLKPIEYLHENGHKCVALIYEEKN
jgi:hypothetical protein